MVLRQVCILFLGMGVAFALSLGTASAQEATVGMPVKIAQLVLPGPELEVKPIDSSKAPLVLRVVNVFPHGTDFRYDFEWYGLEPGSYDLRNFLQHKDGKPATNLPSIPVTVIPVRPPGQVEPNPLTIEAGPRVGGYRLLLWVGGVAWVVGLLAIVLSFFFPRIRKAAHATDKPLSLADRLTPLVEGAIAGKLSEAELAKLERGLFTYWRNRLKLDHTEPAVAIQTLRNHTDAGPLLVQLESWLHKPGPREAVNVADLLKPYRDLAPDAVELGESK